jgi:predicted transcriptional regulator
MRLVINLLTFGFLSVIVLMTMHSIGRQHMFVPQWVHEEFSGLVSDDDPLSNLRSLERLGDWVDDLRLAVAARAKETGHTLQEIGDVQQKPRQAVHRTLRSAQSRGLTDPEFDGVDSSTLRYWFDWWSDEGRTAGGSEEAGRDPGKEAARVLAELDARYNAGILRKRPGGLGRGRNG